MVIRDFPIDHAVSIAELKIFTLTGVRRAGKSSILMLMLRHLRERGLKANLVNLEDTRLRGIDNALDRVLEWNGDDGYLLLDEIASAKDRDG